jgi:hypothetical protein
MTKIKMLGGLALSMFACLVLIVACQKETPGGEQSAQVSKDKAIVESMLTDADLIKAVKGLDPAYNNVSDIFDLLLDNMPLSGAVLSAVSAEERFENDFVEMVYIISAPVSSASIENLKAVRPALQMKNILIAQSKPASFKSFVIINDPVRQIIFGEKLIAEAVPTPECSDCSSIIRNAPGTPGGIAISFGTDETGEPEFFRLFGCNPEKWVCGKPVRLNDMGNGQWYSQCEGTRKRCRSHASAD